MSSEIDSESILEKVDDKTKHLIYGYLNEIERKLLNKYEEMPVDIKNLCILYYLHFISQWKLYIKAITNIGFEKAVIINRADYKTIESTNYKTDRASVWYIDNNDGEKVLVM